MARNFLRSTAGAAILLLATLAVPGDTAEPEPEVAEPVEVDDGDQANLSDDQGCPWVAVEPRSALIQAEFTLPKAEGDERNGRLTVLKAGGTVAANIERWRHQFEELKEKPVEELHVSGTKVTLVDLSGTYKEYRGVRQPVIKRTGYRMLGAIISKPDGLWFVKGYGPEKTMARHADAFRAWVKARAALPDVVPKEGRKDRPANDVLHVRFRILGGEVKKPLAGLKLTVRSAGKEVHGTTEADGGATFELPPGPHDVSFTSPQALPYLCFDRMNYEHRRSKWRSIHLNDRPKEQAIDLVLADPCELVFRAVDVDTGKGIAGVGFAMENPPGEAWADPILNDTIRPEGSRAKVDKQEAAELTDKQGYFRRLRGPWHEKWTYFVNVLPDDYGFASPPQVKIDTSLGKKKAEHTFTFRRKGAPR